MSFALLGDIALGIDGHRTVGACAGRKHMVDISVKSSIPHGLGCTANGHVNYFRDVCESAL